jgi:hypothetical protein
VLVLALATPAAVSASSGGLGAAARVERAAPGRATGTARAEPSRTRLTGIPLRVQSAQVAPEAVSEDETEARARFLVERLEDRQAYARRWYNSWFAVYTGGAVVSSVRAGIADGEGARTENIVSAVKSAIGLVNLLRLQLPERHGAAPVLEIGADEPVQRLEAAETIVESAAARARDQRGWKEHLGNVVLNAIGGGILWAGGSPQRAAISTGVGLAFGELFIWTQPYGAVEDWDDYRERFGAPVREGLTVAPFPGGLALETTF